MNIIITKNPEVIEYLRERGVVGRMAESASVRGCNVYTDHLATPMPELQAAASVTLLAADDGVCYSEGTFKVERLDSPPPTAGPDWRP